MLIVELNNVELIKNNNIDGFLVGVEDISSETYKHFTLEEAKRIIDLIHNQQKKVYIDATQIFHDQDLIKVEEIIMKLSDSDGFFYKDLAVQKYVEKEKRIYFSITYTTNQRDFDLIKEENQLSLVSPNLSYEELKKFNFLNQSLFIAFGTWEIFHSRRPLLSNYFTYRNIEFSSGKYEIIEEYRNELYPIVETNGTKIYLNKYYYLGKELKEINNNILIKSFDLELPILNEIVNIYAKTLNTFDYEKIEEELNNYNLPLHKGLLYEDSLLLKEVRNRE